MQITGNTQTRMSGLWPFRSPYSMMVRWRCHHIPNWNVPASVRRLGGRRDECSVTAYGALLVSGDK